MSFYQSNEVYKVWLTFMRGYSLNVVEQLKMDTHTYTHKRTHISDTIPPLHKMREEIISNQNLRVNRRVITSLFCKQGLSDVFVYILNIYSVLRPKMNVTNTLGTCLLRIKTNQQIEKIKLKKIGICTNVNMNKARVLFT